jgi:hypothetical protein
MKSFLNGHNVLLRMYLLALGISWPGIREGSEWFYTKHNKDTVRLQTQRDIATKIE